MNQLGLGWYLPKMTLVGFYNWVTGGLLNHKDCLLLNVIWKNWGHKSLAVKTVQLESWRFRAGVAVFRRGPLPLVGKTSFCGQDQWGKARVNGWPRQKKCRGTLLRPSITQMNWNAMLVSPEIAEPLKYVTNHAADQNLVFGEKVQWSPIIFLSFCFTHFCSDKIPLA